jgi:hypothetical protein
MTPNGKHYKRKPRKRRKKEKKNVGKEKNGWLGVASECRGPVILISLI